MFSSFAVLFDDFSYIEKNNDFLLLSLNLIIPFFSEMYKSASIYIKIISIKIQFVDKR